MTIQYVSHNFVLAFWIVTRVLIVMSGRLRVVELYLISVTSCDS